MKSIKKTLVLLTALVLCAAAQSHAANLITNGNFEDPDLGPGFAFQGIGAGSTALTGYTVGGGGVELFGVGVFNSDPLPGGGGQKVQLQGGGGSQPPSTQGSLTQAITLELGSIYTVSFDYIKRPGTDFGNGTVTFNDQTFSFVGTDTWQNFTFTSTPAPTTSGTISFIGVNPITGVDGSGNNVFGNNAAIIDNVSVNAVPEPGTVASIMAGGVALLGLSRFRKNAAV